MKPLGIMLLSAVFTTIIFGGFMMWHDSNNHARCPISALALDGGDCANSINSFGLAISHLNAVLTVSTGIVVWPIIVSVIIALGIFLPFGAKGPPRMHSFGYSERDGNGKTDIFRAKFLRWLSFFEKRDPLALAAAKT